MNVVLLLSVQIGVCFSDSGHRRIETMANLFALIADTRFFWR